MNTVLYVESSFNPELNKAIQKHYKKIIKRFEKQGIDFCYLPLLAQSDQIKAIVDYNHPYFYLKLQEIPIADIYRYIIQKNHLEIAGGAFIGFGLNEPEEVELCKSIDPNSSIKKQIKTFIADLYDSYFKSSQLHQCEDDGIRYRMGDNCNDEDILFRESDIFADADILFDRESKQLADQIMKNILQLKEKGSLKLLAAIIGEMQNVTATLSKLYITNDYRIFLKDYGMKEVGMPPLPKALFFLFLNHPEGILFKSLSDYCDELLTIYKNISLRENIDTMIESIKAMTNPLDNSVNEKCSRIREGFLKQITEELAINYFVTGRRGEPKRIILDRSLVEYQ